MAETRNPSFCGSPEHALDRRRFLGTLAAGAAAFAADMTALDVLRSPAVAADLKQKGKRVILLWLAGGSSQLETWDPKPGAPTGGPFRSIPTSVPGVHISELMPKMAAQMDRTCIIRSLNTKNGDHGGAAKLMMQGRRDDPSVRYPDLGAVLGPRAGPGAQPGARLRHVLLADRGAQHGAGLGGLPGRALCPDVADHRRGAREPPPPRQHRRPRPRPAGRAARPHEPPVRPRPVGRRRPRQP